MFEKKINNNSALDVVFDKYMNKTTTRLSKQASMNNKLAFENHIAPFFEDQPYTSIDTYDVEAFLDMLQNTIKRKGSATILSPTTQYHIFRLLHKIFDMLVKEKFIKSNPCDDVDRHCLPWPKHEPTGTLLPVELDLLLNKLLGTDPTPSSIKNVLIIWLLLSYEMTIPEILNLRWNDTKATTLNDLPIDPICRSLFESHKKYQDEYLKAKDARNPLGYIFIQRFKPDGKDKTVNPAKSSVIYQWLVNFCKRNDIVKVTTRMLAKTAKQYDVTLEYGRPIEYNLMKSNLNPSYKVKNNHSIFEYCSD